jgi:hypothetical protein
MRSALLPALAVLALVPMAGAQAQSPTTTRIETRPFYGATVTLEEGVRVFRPLPPHGHIVINPGGVTPLSLGIQERHSVSQNYNYNAGVPEAAAANASAGGLVGGVGQGRGQRGDRRGPDGRGHNGGLIGVRR